MVRSDKCLTVSNIKMGPSYRLYLGTTATSTRGSLVQKDDVRYCNAWFLVNYFLDNTWQLHDVTILDHIMYMGLFAFVISPTWWLLSKPSSCILSQNEPPAQDGMTLMMYVPYEFEITISILKCVMSILTPKVENLVDYSELLFEIISDGTLHLQDHYPSSPPLFPEAICGRCVAQPWLKLKVWDS